LLDGAVRWLLAHMVDMASGPTVPYFVAEGAEPGPARPAWCYGDPGVAATLLLAARDVGKPAWAAAAIDLAVRAAARPARRASSSSWHEAGRTPRWSMLNPPAAVRRTSCCAGRQFDPEPPRARMPSA
jgi:hypothetical protein